MALKTPGKTPSAVESTDPETVLLELALYTNYTWQGAAFQKGKAYRFSRADAMTLMGEMDHGRPVWKQWRPAKPKAEPQNVVLDATALTMPDPQEPLHGLTEEKRISVGDDAEIADILKGTEGEGNVQI